MKKFFTSISLVIVLATFCALPAFAVNKSIISETDSSIENEISIENNSSEKTILETIEEIAEKYQDMSETEYCQETIQEVIDALNQEYDVNLRIESVDGKEVDLNTPISKEYKELLTEYAITTAGFTTKSRSRFEANTSNAESVEKITLEESDSNSFERAAQGYKKSKNIDGVPVTLIGTVEFNSYWRFLSVDSLKGKGVYTSNSQIFVDNTDNSYRFIDSRRTCEVTLPVTLGVIVNGEWIHSDTEICGEFYASES